MEMFYSNDVGNSMAIGFISMFRFLDSAGTISSTTVNSFNLQWLIKEAAARIYMRPPMHTMRFDTISILSSLGA